MNIKAIIFDKDGTLLDFDAFWVTVCVKAIEDVLMQFGKQDVPVDKILASLGVHNGTTDINGVLCKGTYQQIGRIVYDTLQSYGCSASCETVTTAVTDAFNKNADAGEIKPTCPNLAQVLTLLKKRNIRLAVVTTDNQEITEKCLKALGIYGLFDRIYTDDGETPTKPDPYCALDFLKLTGLEKDNLLMVGDTMTDMVFAKNAGISAVGIAKSDANRLLLMPHASEVISDMTSLLGMLGSGV